MIDYNVAEFLNDAGITITNEKVSLREKGIDAYIKKLLRNWRPIELIKLYYTGQCDEKVFNDFVATFKKSDNTFLDNMTYEIQVLAGAVLSKIALDNLSDERISLIEMYVCMYEFLGYKSVNKNFAIRLITDFDKRRAEVREKVNTTDKNIKLLEKVKFNHSEEEPEFDANVADDLENMAHKVNEIIKTYNENQAFNNLRINLLQEESKMLWWLLTGISDDINQKYCEIECKQAAILAGMDLAKRVSAFPGPYAAKKLLEKTITSDKTFSFDEYIESVADSIISGIHGNSIETPVLYALKKKEEAGSGCWNKSFSRLFRVEKEEFTLLEMAYETYLECLVLDKSIE